jgi:hypothetical protein
MSCEAMRDILSQAVPLVDESRALSYALAMSLAATPCQEFTRDEVDALCQLAYELQIKLARASALFQNIDNLFDPRGGSSTNRRSETAPSCP